MKWIKVTDSLPPPLEDVLVLIPQRDSVTHERTQYYCIQTAYRSLRDRWLVNCYIGDESDPGKSFTAVEHTIEYWTPIPKLKINKKT